MRFRLYRCLFRIHPLFIALFVLTFMLGQFQSLLAGLFALCLHEGGHLLTAARFHIPVQEVVLSPMGGVMRCDTQHISPVKSILFSLSGPAASLLGYLISYCMLQSVSMHVIFWLDFLRSNLLLFLINLLPVLPLDGGHCLLSLLKNAPLCRRILYSAGILTGCLLILLSFWFAWQGHIVLTPALAGCFLLYCAALEKRSLAAHCMHRVLSTDIQLRKHRLLPLHYCTACGTMTLIDAATQCPDNCCTSIVVVSKNDFHTLGTLSAHDFCDALLTDSHMTLEQALKNRRH